MSCAPCPDCPQTPPPVLPRCDVVLPDGTYANATVVVENGCITGVQAGALQVYTPDLCCPTGGGSGGGGDGLDGPPGPPGANATIAVGSVTSLAPGAVPTVVNSGTPSSAILNFGIPRGADGADGDGSTIGATVTAAGIELENGIVRSVPAQWPPVMHLLVNPVSTIGVSLTATEDTATGVFTLTLDMAPFVAALTADFQASLDVIDGQMSALQTQIISLQTALLVCCPGAVLDINGNGLPDPGGTPGVSPSPPVIPN